MPKRYMVQLPITGVVTVEVDADSEDEAIEKAMNTTPSDDDVTWETHKIVCQGNMYCGELNEATAEEVESDDE